jgi:WD40 repeat protein
MCRASAVLGLLFGLGLVLADDKSALDAIDSKKLLGKLKPGKSAPPEAVAVLGLQEGRCDCLALRADGKMLAYSGSDGLIRLWDLTTLKQQVPLRFTQVVCLAFSPDGKILAAGDSAGSIKLWDFQPGRPAVQRLPFVAHKADEPTWAIAFSPDGKTLASGGADGKVQLWEVGTAGKSKLKATLTGHKKFVRGLSFASGGKFLASAGADDGTFRVWDLSASPPKPQVVDLKDAVATVDFAPDGQTLATSSFDGMVRLWTLDGEQWKEKTAIPCEQKAVSSVAFMGDGDKLVVLMRNKTGPRLSVVDLTGKKLFETKFAHPVHMVTGSPDGRHVIAVNEDSTYILRLPKDS